MKIVVVAGAFNPLTSADVTFFDESAKHGKYLIVGIYSDNWLKRNSKYPHIPWDDRAQVVREIDNVNGVNFFNDDDDSVTDLLIKVRGWYPSDEIIYIDDKGKKYL